MLQIIHTKNPQYLTVDFCTYEFNTAYKHFNCTKSRSSELWVPLGKRPRTFKNLNNCYTLQRSIGYDFSGENVYLEQGIDIRVNNKN